MRGRKSHAAAAKGCSKIVSSTWERVVSGYRGAQARPAPAPGLRFDMGATDLLDVLQLQAKQLNTQFELISIRNDRLTNRVALHLALGGGFTPAANP